MGSPDRAILKREAGATPQDMQAMTDSGDNMVFTISGADVWSGDADHEPDIRPNGILTGRNLVYPTAVADQVAVKGCTVYVNGTKVTISAGTTVSVTRPATDVAKVAAICVDAAGALTEEAGDDGDSASFTETFGDAGGPPIIPDTKVMLGQARITTSASAVLTKDECFNVDGTHNERFDMPMWKEPNTIGDGLDADTPAKEHAHIEFESALPQIHTSGSKPVWAQVAVPTPAEVSRSAAFVAPQATYTSNKEDYYGGSVNSVAPGLNNGSFEVLMTDGVTDAIKRDRGKKKTYWWYPDRNKSAYQLSQGTVAISVTNQIGNQHRGTITLVATREAADFAS